MWLALCLWTALPASALQPEQKLTQYVHRIWQTQPNTLQAVTQTHDGYLWLGTESGILRFDGVRFSRVPELEQASLGDFWARSLVEDSLGRMWIISGDYRLIRVGGDGVKVLTGKDGLPSAEVTCAFASEDGEIWVCTHWGIAHFKGNRFETYGNSLPWQPLAGCQTPDGTIWIAGQGRMASWKNAQFREYPLGSVLSGSGVRSIVCRDDGVWIGTLDGLIQFQDGKEHRYTKENGLPDNEVLSLAKGRSGELWVGTRRGLGRLWGGAFDTFTYSDGLSQQDVLSIYEDKEGTLWVATKQGLNQFLDGPATRFTRKEGLPSDNVGPVLEDHAGNLWVGFLDAGLARWDGRKFSPLHGFESRRITTLMDAADGSVWVGTDHGLDRLEGEEVRESFNTGSGLPSNQVRSLYQDRRGTIWVGTEKGVAMYTNKTLIEPPVFTRRFQVPVVAIGETQSQHILFAPEDGAMFALVDGRLKILENRGGAALQVRNENGGSETRQVTNVAAIETDKNGLVWMGTIGSGLLLLRDGKISQFFRRDGLFDGEIYGLASDSVGRLWIACSAGFYSVTKSDLLAFAAGKIRKVKSSPYVPLEGFRAIPSRRGVQPNVIVRRDGTLWFTTVEGLIAYQPDFATKPRSQPQVLIEDVTVDGVRTNPFAIHHLGPGKQNMAIRYTGFSFLDPQNMTFKYILEGYDHDWTNAGGRREAFYTNLSPGRYRFRVAACSPFVPCNEAGTSVEFDIMPYLYQRHWFWPLIAALLATLAWTGYRFQILRLESRISIILQERARIARELHDTLIQGFSGITMQMRAVTKRLRPSSERQSLEEIIADSAHCLRQTRESVAALRDGEVTSPELAAAIADTAEKVTNQHGVRLELDLDKASVNIPLVTRYNLVRIVQEAVLNAAKHSGARSIRVSLSHTEEEMRLSISDDGSGIANIDNNVEDLHYGITGMRERAEQIGGEFEVASGPEVGTTITVRISSNVHCHRYI